MNAIEVKGYVPGAIGRLAELHARYYSREWGFGLFFEAKVAAEMSSFLQRFDERRDGFWTVCRGSRVEGGVAIDGSEAVSKGAHLRWFILSEELRGMGLGHRLMDAAVRFCGGRRYESVYLWTFDGLQAARHLYEKFGFTLTEEHEGTQWGKRVLEQKYLLRL
jgi:GNAT superfamily N-acetyltransferase